MATPPPDLPDPRPAPPPASAASSQCTTLTPVPSGVDVQQVQRLTLTEHACAEGPMTRPDSAGLAQRNRASKVLQDELVNAPDWQLIRLILADAEPQDLLPSDSRVSAKGERTRKRKERSTSPH